MNSKEIIEALIAGEKITNTAYGSPDTYVHIVNGKIVWNDEHMYLPSSFPNHESGYKIYKPAPKMIRWHKVTYLQKNSDRPHSSEHLHKSEQEFRDRNEPFLFEWVHLEFVCEKPEVTE